MSKRISKGTDQEERFWDHVKEVDGGCWEWQGSRSRDGYGNATWNGKRAIASRVAWTLVVGVIPEGLQIDHLCRNPPCVNPAHLELVRPHENLARRAQNTATHCRRGHPYDEANTYWKRTPGRKPFRSCRACAALKQRERLAADPALRAKQLAATREWRRRRAD